MEHACSKMQSLSLEAAAISILIDIEKSYYNMPFDLSLAAQKRHAQLGCTAKFTEVTGLSQAVALAPSVVWPNL